MCGDWWIQSSKFLHKYSMEKEIFFTVGEINRENAKMTSELEYYGWAGQVEFESSVAEETIILHPISIAGIYPKYFRFQRGQRRRAETMWKKDDSRSEYSLCEEKQ